MSGIHLVLLGTTSGGGNYFIAIAGYSAYTSAQVLAVDSNDNIVIAGGTNITGGTRSITLKYSPTGELEWQKQFFDPSGSTTSANSVAIGTDDSIYEATSFTLSGTPYGGIIKYNSSGTLQLQRTWGKTGSSTVFNKISVDSSNNVFLAGYNNSNGTSFDFNITKWNSTGANLWQRRLGATEFQIPQASAVDSSGNFYVGGYRNQNLGVVIPWAYLAKYNSSGTLQWQKQYAYSGNVASIDFTSDGSIVICGTTNGEPRITKLNSSGTVIWQRKISTATNFRGIAVDSADNIYVAAELTPLYWGGLYKYDTNGTLQWQRVINTIGGSSNFSYLVNVKLDSEENLCIAGAFQKGDVSPVRQYTFLLKLPNDGSKTGTYPILDDISISYQPDTLTSTTASTSVTNGTLSATTPSLVQATSAYTTSNGTLTPSSVSL